MNSWYRNGGKAAHILLIEAGFSRIKSLGDQSPYFCMFIPVNCQTVGAKQVEYRVKSC